jgi:hypothetical protein
MSPIGCRRARGIRAFADKNGGWTLVTPGGEFLSLRNVASLCLWESLAEASDVSALTERLQRRFPEVPAGRVREDVFGFLRDLEAHGFIEIRPARPAAVSGNPEAD